VSSSGSDAETSSRHPPGDTVDGSRLVRVLVAHAAFIGIRRRGKRKLLWMDVDVANRRADSCRSRNCALCILIFETQL
jgi:hypothetical protein